MAAIRTLGRFQPSRLLLAATFSLALAALAACGGGGGGGNGGGGNSSGGNNATTGNVTASAPIVLAQEPNAPALTNDTATDGLNWFNFRRQQMGLATVSRNGLIDAAALSHSQYQRLNNTISHQQIAGRPGFTGVELYDQSLDPVRRPDLGTDRLRAAGYNFSADTYAYGEVISASGDPSGFTAAEDLITAIYHRFVIFEPMFRIAGAGSATVTGGYTYFTTDFAADGLGAGIGTGNLLTYPYAGQANIPVIFYSDRESPDPVADRNAVGYPISVHANITSRIVVQSFTVQPRGGTALARLLLSSATDVHTARSAAAIVPLAVLAPRTTYDVEFTGTVDGAAVTRNWSFTTQ
jgi:uncharacterized protein YkwD